ncbi:unnamed protein product [Adineta steineri]|uniref:Decapping nuclease n=1 Tax=Adineta steineri TaxID=433720 RepID=A0A815BWL3_9BILA|nr:unnamed protein product [Adineta steineri]CAF1281014.1 unnamed protein product [Adineta steineri]CAF1335553.1 unnamed protein product [Adineta steineri]CAF4087530.1 unnamed protein product [Adineta steineri]CAF4165639.1 unnamed protein product [Adineta steineri]
MANVSISEDIFNQLTFIREYENNQDGENNAIDSGSIINGYQPRILTDFNLDWQLPADHLAIQLYRDATTVPANRIPFFTAPAINTNFPVGDPNYIPQPRNTSFLPCLIAAKATQVDFRQYDIVSERNSLRKIAMNAEKYAVGVMRYGRTLLLRRYDRRSINRNNVGFLFEEMCTPSYPPGAEYKYLIEGRIGTLRALVTAEIDAVSNENTQTNNSIELTCRKEEKIHNRVDAWLQMFLSGTATLTVGHRSIDEPIRLLGVNNYNIEDLIDQEDKIRLLQHLHQVLRFLQANVQEKRNYILYRHPRNQSSNDMGLFLYEITNPNDIQRLQFMPRWMLEQMFVSNQ